MVLKVGITGQSGFIGTHLYNYLGLQKGIERISFDDDYFDNEQKLQDFVRSCNVIVHLAALNRHNDPQLIFETNIRLVEQLINACESTQSKPKIIFSSSVQEFTESVYGKSKREGRKLFEQWAAKNKALFTALIIPNVFGPFGNPYYNSFIATFCHQLTHGETPELIIDNEVELIYVGELVQEINRVINEDSPKNYQQIPFTAKLKVSSVLNLLKSYKEAYFKKGIIPSIQNNFERDLFNTFLCYIDHQNFFPFFLTNHADERGSFVEIIKLNSGGQISFSTTNQGITRGNHYHTRKVERFSVIKGKAKIELRKIGTKKVISFELNGNQPSFIDIPIWFTHKITNIGNEELYTIFWINEHYDPTDSDTFIEEV